MHCSVIVPEAEKILLDALRSIVHNKTEDPKFPEMVEKIVLPGFSLLHVRSGCICLTLQADNLSTLKELWERHKSGCLQKSLQELLVTDEIKGMADGKEIKVKVNADLDSYRNAYLHLFIAEKEGGLD